MLHCVLLCKLWIEHCWLVDVGWPLNNVATSCGGSTSVAALVCGYFKYVCNNALDIVMLVSVQLCCQTTSLGDRTSAKRERKKAETPHNTTHVTNHPLARNRHRQCLAITMSTSSVLVHQTCCACALNSNETQRTCRPQPLTHCSLCFRQIDCRETWGSWATPPARQGSFKVHSNTTESAAKCSRGRKA